MDKLGSTFTPPPPPFKETVELPSTSKKNAYIGVCHEAKLEDSNMALYNSKEHHEAILAAAERETHFSGAGVKVGTRVWRVENHKFGEFGIADWPKNRYGEFFNGDSFLVLHSRQKKGGFKKTTQPTLDDVDTSMVSKPTKKDSDVTKTTKKNSDITKKTKNITKTTKQNSDITKKTLSHDIYFWLGKKSSVDERGVAAYKAFELEEFLGGMVKQHRIIEGGESQAFMKCFEKPICIMNGGIDSGFHHISTKVYQPRLLWIKGHGKQMRVQQVPLACSSLNVGDCFVLDTGLLLFQYHGKSSSCFEKRRAHEVLESIRSARFSQGARMLPTIIIELPSSDSPEFWANLSGNKSEIKSAVEGGDDFEPKLKTRLPRLYRVSDVDSKVTFTLEAKADLSLTMLDTNDVFVVDAVYWIFVWVGNGSSRAERREAMCHAEKFLSQSEDPLAANTPISRVFENDTALPKAFTSIFLPEAEREKKCEKKNKKPFIQKKIPAWVKKVRMKNLDCKKNIM